MHLEQPTPLCLRNMHSLPSPCAGSLFQPHVQQQHPAIAATSTVQLCRNRHSRHQYQQDLRNLSALKHTAC